MSYGQNLVHDKTHPQAGWAPIGFAAMVTQDPLNILLWSYLILSDTQIANISLYILSDIIMVLVVYIIRYYNGSKNLG